MNVGTEYASNLQQKFLFDRVQFRDQKDIQIGMEKKMIEEKYLKIFSKTLRNTIK